MNAIKYKAQKVDGNKTFGIYTGNDFYSLVRMLRAEGYFVTSVRKTMQLSITNNRASNKDLWIFTSQFSEILSAGINIDKALSLLIDISTNRIINKSLFQIKADIDGGTKLQDALSKFKYIYPEFMINMIGIGEESGNLDIILKNLSEFYKKEWELRQRIRGAMAYPMVVMLFTVIAVGIIVNTVIPKIVDVILSLGGTIPFSTKFMLKINSILKTHIIVIMLIISLIIFYLKKKEINVLRLICIKTPYLKQIYLDINISRLSSALSLLLESGINIIDSLRLISNTTGDIRIRNQIIKCVNEINNGNSLLNAIDKTDLHKGILNSMISLGESTGKLDQMLLKASEIIDENNERKIKKLLSFLEPFLIILLTVVVGTTIINIIIPMINVMDSIK